LNDLFKPKKPVEEIRDKLAHYDEMHLKMVATSSKDEDYPLFRIKTHKIKQAIAKQIDKLKKAILDKVSEWCVKEVQNIKEDYLKMGERIWKPPNDEEELVEIRAYIDNASKMNQDLQARVRNVGNHI